MNKSELYVLINHIFRSKQLENTKIIATDLFADRNNNKYLLYASEFQSFYDLKYYKNERSFLYIGCHHLYGDDDDYILPTKLVASLNASVFVNNNTCCLNSISIENSNYARIGLGTHMLDMLEYISKVKGLERINGLFSPMNENVSNFEQTKNFYEKNGYVINGHSLSKQIVPLDLNFYQDIVTDVFDSECLLEL